MKKHIIAAFLAIVMCVAMLAGCSLVKGLERDVQVVLNVNGEVRGVHTVNTFNNALIPESELPTDADVPEGKTFIGWTAQENWEELEYDQVVVTANKGLIRYNDVKDYVKGKELSVTLYAAFVVVPPKDLVVAWYRAEGVSTQTGLTQEIMDSFTEDMYSYLDSKGYVTSEMDIVVRAYDANVGTSCGNITKDGDVNIMVGWGSNIGTQGGINFIENVEGVQIGTISRYAARLDNNYLTRLVFVWILNTYGGQNLPEPDPNDVIPDVPDEPDVPDVPDEPGEIVLPNYTIPAEETCEIIIAWYDASASGMTEAIVVEMETALKADLAAMGYNLDNTTVTFRKYDGNVADSCKNIMADDDVDIMIGWAANINTNGEMKNEEENWTYYRENIAAGLVFGEKTGRYVATISDKFITDVVCAWVRNNYKAEGAESVEYPAGYGWDPAGDVEEVIPPIPAPEGTEYTLVIGWYSKSSTSGLTLDMMTSFVASLGKHLTEAGYGGDGVKVKIDLRDLSDGGVADVGKIVNDAGDYDILFGMGNNITTSAGIDVKKNGEGGEYRLDGVTMGEKSRNIAIVASSENEFAVTIYNWLLGENSDGWLYSNEAKEIGIYIA